MPEPRAARADFITRVLTSSFAGEVAKRFPFADGEVGVLYTMGRDRATGQACPVLLYVATFPPSPQQGGRHDFGIDFREQPVGSAEEAARVMAQFQRAEAQAFRASCRA
ncbi:MAG: hypothetical protein EOO62_15530 [Hymenobacter sp.]|nr:MAG: hypothetical protein EOO62_15530 [Hymenobacter sp.]